MPRSRVPRLLNAMIGIAGLALCFAIYLGFENWVHDRWIRTEDATAVIWRLRVVFGLLMFWISFITFDGMRRKPFLS